MNNQAKYNTVRKKEGISGMIKSVPTCIYLTRKTDDFLVFITHKDIISIHVKTDTRS